VACNIPSGTEKPSCVVRDGAQNDSKKVPLIVVLETLYLHICVPFILRISILEPVNASAILAVRHETIFPGRIEPPGITTELTVTSVVRTAPPLTDSLVKLAELGALKVTVSAPVLENPVYQAAARLGLPG